jgi:hypothetical protein
MGIFFGRNTGSRSYTASADLARKLRRRGGGDSTGAGQLLAAMEAGQDPVALCPEAAEQAARSLRQAAGRLRGDDRRIATQIADDAQAAADAGRSWTVG